MMRKIIVGAVLLAACAVAQNREQEVRDAEKAWAAAVVKRDFAALDRILADQLIYAHSNGVIEAKSEYVGKLRSGAQRYDAIEHQKMEIRLHGDAAVAHSHVLMKGKNPKGPFDDRLMMLHLWVKRDGRWQLAAHQTTNLAGK